MKRAKFPHRKEQRRTDAALRQLAYDTLSDAEKAARNPRKKTEA